jgi:hypothetical protein
MRFHLKGDKFFTILNPKIKKVRINITMFFNIYYSLLFHSFYFIQSF